MLGWQGLAEKTDRVLGEMPSSTLVFCDNYVQAGANNFFTRGRVKAQGFDGDYGAWLDRVTPYRHLVL